MEERLRHITQEFRRCLLTPKEWISSWPSTSSPIKFISQYLFLFIGIKMVITFSLHASTWKPGMGVMRLFIDAFKKGVIKQSLVPFLILIGISFAFAAISWAVRERLALKVDFKGLFSYFLLPLLPLVVAQPIKLIPKVGSIVAMIAAIYTVYLFVQVVKIKLELENKDVVRYFAFCLFCLLCSIIVFAFGKFAFSAFVK